MRTYVPTEFRKECTLCGTLWTNNKEFLKETTPVCEYSEFGLALRNHTCGTTLGVEPELLWPEKTEFYQKLWTYPDYFMVPIVRKKKQNEMEGGDYALEK